MIPEYWQVRLDRLRSSYPLDEWDRNEIARKLEELLNKEYREKPPMDEKIEALYYTPG